MAGGGFKKKNNKTIFPVSKSATPGAVYVSILADNHTESLTIRTQSDNKIAYFNFFFKAGSFLTLNMKLMQNV